MLVCLFFHCLSTLLGFMATFLVASYGTSYQIVTCLFHIRFQCLFLQFPFSLIKNVFNYLPKNEASLDMSALLFTTKFFRRIFSYFLTNSCQYPYIIMLIRSQIFLLLSFSDITVPLFITQNMAIFFSLSFPPVSCL